MLFTSFSPWYKFVKSALAHKHLIYAQERPSSYQAIQFFKSTVESIQFLSDYIIKDPSINESLAKFLDLGAVIHWMLQNGF